MPEVGGNGVPTPEPSAKDFGARLQVAREERGMSQEEAARALGYPVRSITRWETGKSIPSVLKSARMAGLYKVSMDWLVGRTATKGLLRPGATVWSPSVVETLTDLANRKLGLGSIPPQLRRHPGVNCTVAIPEDAVVLTNGAESALAHRVNTLLAQLKANKS